jgi:hypothetical protein
MQNIFLQSGLNIWFLHTVMFGSKLKTIEENLNIFKNVKNLEIANKANEKIQIFLSDYMTSKLNN